MDTDTATWLRSAIGEDRIKRATSEAARYGIVNPTDKQTEKIDEQELRFIVNALELQLFYILDDKDHIVEMRSVAAETFKIAKILKWPDNPIGATRWLLHLGCLAVAGDCSTDYQHMIADCELPNINLDSPDWGIRVWSSVLYAWLLIISNTERKNMSIVKKIIIALREDQINLEHDFLKNKKQAWQLITQYHLLKAAEILSVALTHGVIDDRNYIRSQIKKQFNYALKSSSRGHLIEQEMLSKLLARVTSILIDTCCLSA